MPVDTKEMQEYRKLIDSGQYIPDHAIMNIFSSFIEAEVKQQNFDPKKEFLLLDGLPRTVEQAHALEKLVKVACVISFTIPDEKKLIERIQKRAIKSGRTDDSSYEVLQTRMNVYNEKTAPILKHFDSSRVAEVNADQKPLEVFRDLLQASASYLPLTLEK
jgi:adenylate kinase